jgi:glucose-1-phosphate cytidylyltransferase
MHPSRVLERGRTMKMVILAGGYGTRISEESGVRPKPLVEIGGQPILWHIMKIYSAYGLNDFVVCCGYKGHMIKQYFRDYALARSDIIFDLHDFSMQTHRNGVEPWRVTLVDTGEKTMTGGRRHRHQHHRPCRLPSSVGRARHDAPSIR